MTTRREDRIERIELYHVEVPLPTSLFPSWIPGHAVDALASTLLIVHTHGGLRGYATGPAMGRERDGLGAFIGPFLVGLDPFDIDQARERLRQASYLGWRNNWMDLAFWDLAAQARGLPVHELMTERLGACARAKSDPVHRVSTFAAFQESRPPRARAEAVERALSLGFRGVQFGVQSETEAEDLDLLETVRAAAGGEAELYVHAHQAWGVSLVQGFPTWSFDRAARFMERAAELRYARVQEPLHEEDWDGMAQLRATAKVPLGGGDLSVSAAQLRNQARLGCFDVLTPSAGLAGLTRLEGAMRAALEFDLDVCPMTYGDGFELIAHLHACVAWSRLASQPERVRLAFPWDPPAQRPEYRDALLGLPLQVDSEGCLPVPDQPGLGVRVDPAALKRFGTLFYELTPVRLLVSSARKKGLRHTAEIAQRPRKVRGQA